MSACLIHYRNSKRVLILKGLRQIIEKNPKNSGLFTTINYSQRQPSSSDSKVVSGPKYSEINKNELTDFEIDELIDEKRNKSKLNEYHYRLLHEQPPVLSEDEKYIMPLSKYRRLFGVHGDQSKINIASLWPSKKEMMLAKEREQVEYPHTVLDMIKIEEDRKYDNTLTEMEIQRKIVGNMKNLDKWLQDVRDKMLKKENDARLHKEKKQKQIEEVQQMFGFYVSPSDEKFKEALEQKEVERKKLEKKAKKLKKQQMILEKLTEEAKQHAESSETEEIHGKSIVEGQVLPDKQ